MYLLQLTPKAIACAIPNFGTFRAHNGLKCSVRQILPPLQTVEICDFVKYRVTCVSGNIIFFHLIFCEVQSPLFVVHGIHARMFT